MGGFEDTGPGPTAGPPSSAVGRSRTLREIAWLFLRLGTTSFGGPAVHIALMEDEVVRRRAWMTHGQFLDLLGATNLIPGPNSTEMAIHIGWHRARWAGLLTAGACFIGPSALIILALGWAYLRFGSRPEAAGLLYGIKPVIIAVVVQALWRLGRSALKSRGLALLALAAVALNILGVNELVLLVSGGLAVAIGQSISRQRGRGGPPKAPGLLPLLLAPIGVQAVTASPFSVSSLFWILLKIGSILYGSGYVLLAFLRADLVERRGWLTEAELLDAVAIGQFMPGPITTTATFIGYILGGLPGAAAATVGIFLPSFAFVALSGPLIPQLRRSATAGAFLDGVIVASMALMAVVTWELAKAALIDPLTTFLAVLGGLALIRFRLNSAWLVLAGGIVGLLAWR